MRFGWGKDVGFLVRAIDSCRGMGEKGGVKGAGADGEATMKEERPCR